jgi:DNA polymerase III alpha subunit (gram-positive type)
MLRKKKFAIVDIETTGGKSQYHRIIESSTGNSSHHYPFDRDTSV